MVRPCALISVRGCCCSVSPSGSTVATSLGRRGIICSEGCEPQPAERNTVARMQTQPVEDVWPRHALWRAVFSPPFIYSTIIVGAVIIVADDFESDLELLEITLGTVFVVWVGHVF